MNPLRSPARICSRIGLALLALIGVWLGVAVIIMIPIMIPSITAGGANPLENLWVMLAINDIPLYAAAMPVFLLILRTIPDGPAEARPAPRRVTPGWFLLMLGITLGAIYLLSGLTDMVKDLVSISRNLLGTDALDQMLSQDDFWPQLIFMAIVPAIGEEFLFRYTLRKKLRGSGDKIYILFSAFCFALFHMNFSQVFFAFAAGVLFAWTYLVTDKIWVPMVLHFCINFSSVALSYVPADSLAFTIITFVTFALMAMAVVLFIVFIRRVNRALVPPSEPGWSRRGPAWPQQQGYYPPQPPAYGFQPAPHYPQPQYYQPPPQYQQAPPYAQAAPPPYYPPHQPQYQQPYQQAPPAYYPPGQAPYPPPQYYQPQPPPYYGYPQPWAYPPGHYPPHGYTPYGYAWGYPPGGYPPAPPRGAGAVCLGNVGMILFTVLTGILVLATMFL